MRYAIQRVVSIFSKLTIKTLHHAIDRPYLALHKITLSSSHPSNMSTSDRRFGTDLGNKSGALLLGKDAKTTPATLLLTASAASASAATTTQTTTSMSTNTAQSKQKEKLESWKLRHRTAAAAAASANAQHASQQTPQQPQLHHSAQQHASQHQSLQQSHAKAYAECVVFLNFSPLTVKFRTQRLVHVAAARRRRLGDTATKAGCARHRDASRRVVEHVCWAADVDGGDGGVQ
jgi:cytoskeletal protein RodZ